MIGSKKDHAISFHWWKINPLYRHDLLTRVFPRFSLAVFASLIGKFERLHALWLAAAITSVFTHEDPTENALRRFPTNETVVELGYNAVPRLENRLHVSKVRYVKGSPVPYILIHVSLTLTSFAIVI